MSSKSKLLLIVAVALLVVGVGFIVTQGYVEKGPDGYYDYDFSYADSFTTSEGYQIAPSEGRTFVIANVVIQNDSYSPGIDTSPTASVWRLTLDRMSYDLNAIYTTMHPNYYAGLVINEGRTWGYTVVFEVPTESVGKKDASISFSYLALSDKPMIEFDPNLVLPEFGGAI